MVSQNCPRFLLSAKTEAIPTIAIGVSCKRELIRLSDAVLVVCFFDIIFSNGITINLLNFTVHSTNEICLKIHYNLPLINDEYGKVRALKHVSYNVLQHPLHRLDINPHKPTDCQDH